MMTAIRNAAPMMLSDLLYGIVNLPIEADQAIKQLRLDSRHILHGDVFIACKGQTVDGRHYIDQAIEKGAAAVIWDSDRTTVPIPLTWRHSPSGRRIPCVAVNNLSQLVGVLADRFYQGPSKSMYVIGVTGTNGKTSTTQYIAQLHDDLSCGIIGTLGWGFSNQLNESQHTTPDALTTHAWLAQLRDGGARRIAMEVSSHALDQSRVSGVAFDCAVFTNLSHDHLDYHKDMESYARCKRKLFAMPTLQHAVVNSDDPESGNILSILAQDVAVLTYGTQPIPNVSYPDVFADQISLDSAGIRFILNTPVGKANLSLPLYGRFNISNVLAAAAVMLHNKTEFSDLISRLHKLKPVLGRMQLERSHSHATVVVDYAHTPDALQQALSSLRQHVDGKLWCVFGCGGNRDQGKRPKMGAIAQQSADRIVITSDNPRHEDPEHIIEQIKAGMVLDSSIIIQPDRAAAIRYALSNAHPDDIVLIAGKGHESYQQIGDKKLPFNDIAQVRQVLREMNDAG